MDEDENQNDKFDTFFPFFGGFDRCFEDMHRQMDEMGKHFEQMFRDSDLHLGFSVPGLTQNLPPLESNTSPLTNDPRNQMLKDESMQEPTKVSNTSQIAPVSSGRNSRFWSWNTSDLLSDLSNPNTSVIGRMKSVRTIRREDGSVERIEKTTENGKTCTTVTKTDPNGVTTTTTTCDRPGLENGPRNSMMPSLPAPPGSDSGSPGTGNDSKSNMPKQNRNSEWDYSKSKVPHLNTELSREDEGYFSKLFGNLGFGKPRS